MEPEHDEMWDDAVWAALGDMPSEDMDSYRAERVRQLGRRELQRSYAVSGSRARSELRSLYTSRVEPALLVGYGVIALGKALLTVARALT